MYIKQFLFHLKRWNLPCLVYVKKDNWKKYIGVNRERCCDVEGNNFFSDHLYKTSDLKNIIEIYKYSDVPKELIKETHDELFEHIDDLKNILENKKKEEFYK